MKVTLIPNEHVAAIWPHVSGFLKPATEAPPDVRHDIVDLYEDCLRQRQLLWVMFDEEKDNKLMGAMTTMPVVYSQYTALSIPYMGGSGVWRMRDEIMRVLTKYARENGFKKIECYGRDEWGRIGRKYGFKKAYSVFEADVDNDDI